MMLRLVQEDWSARLQARLREDVTTQAAEEEEIILEPQPRRDAGLTFGSHGSSPVSGLHFERPDDTAAS